MGDGSLEFGVWSLEFGDGSEKGKGKRDKGKVVSGGVLTIILL